MGLVLYVQRGAALNTNTFRSSKWINPDKSTDFLGSSIRQFLLAVHRLTTAKLVLESTHRTQC